MTGGKSWIGDPYGTGSTFAPPSTTLASEQPDGGEARWPRSATSHASRGSPSPRRPRPERPRLRRRRHARRVEAAAAADIGYIASPDAASLVTGRTKNVGVVIPFVNRWFFGEVLEGIERALLAAGYDLTLYNLSPRADGRDRVFDLFLARKRVDAVIAVGVDLTEHEVDGSTAASPSSAWAAAPGRTHASRSTTSRSRQLATEHLMRLGHTRIAHIGGATPSSPPTSVQAGAAGLRRRARGAGHRRVERAVRGRHDAARRLHRRPAAARPPDRPTAVFAASDEMAIGSIRAAERLGIDVPAELSVIGSTATSTPRCSASRRSSSTRATRARAWSMALLLYDRRGPQGHGRPGGVRAGARPAARLTDQSCGSAGRRATPLHTPFSQHEGIWTAALVHRRAR